jgi:hypothetical protein
MTDRRSDMDDELTQWTHAWRHVDAVPAGTHPDAHVLERLRTDQRNLAAAEIIQAVLSLGALALLAAALGHAASYSEMLLGGLVAVAIVVAWASHASDRRSERGAMLASATEYLAAIHVVRRRQLRLARFVWTVLSLELVFLVVWWMGGVTLHHNDLGSWITVTTLWIPIVAIIVLAVWSVGLYRDARRELVATDRLRRQFIDDGPE